MLDRKEIEKRLEGVDPQLCVAFAARCSLRALPLLIDSKEEIFFSWDKKGLSQYLLEILITQQAPFLGLWRTSYVAFHPSILFT